LPKKKLASTFQLHCHPAWLSLAVGTRIGPQGFGESRWTFYRMMWNIELKITNTKKSSLGKKKKKSRKRTKGVNL
jgi:hypothetical protein